MLNDPLAGKGWPGMAQERMRCAALGAALTAVTRERTQGRPRAAAAACTGPSEQGQDLTGMSQRGSGGHGRLPRAAATTAFLASSRFTAEPTPREIPARYTPRAGGRGCSCVLSGSELSGRLSTSRWLTWHVSENQREGMRRAYHLGLKALAVRWPVRQLRAPARHSPR